MKKLQKYKNTNIKQLSLLLLCIGSSFTFGNLFGIYTKSFSSSYIFVLGALLAIEGVSFVKYSPECQGMEKMALKTTLVSTCFNAVKRGFLIGLFVEAFKVGS
jgi:hypothetical protein